MCMRESEEDGGGGGRGRAARQASDELTAHILLPDQLAGHLQQSAKGGILQSFQPNDYVTVLSENTTSVMIYLDGRIASEGERQWNIN